MIPAGLEILAIPFFAIGVILLYKGSDILVDGTSKTAAHFGLSALIISVIVIAFGTSAPEFAISVGAAIEKHADISIGNIIGSCIANILLVIGISAVIKPIKVTKKTMMREMLLMVCASIIFLVSTYFNLLDNLHLIGGILYLFLFSAFLLFFYKCAKNERVDRIHFEEGELKKNILFIIFGIIGVVIGAQFLIESAITIANVIGISQLVIALSMVAVGTSLPELVVSAMAAYKNESDIALGNVIGSNIFNIFLILGLCSLLIPLNALVSFNTIVILLIVSFMMFPIVYTGEVISRKEGLFLLIIYFIFIGYIYL